MPPMEYPRGKKSKGKGPAPSDSSNSCSPNSEPRSDSTSSSGDTLRRAAQTPLPPGGDTDSSGSRTSQRSSESTSGSSGRLSASGKAHTPSPLSHVSGAPGTGSDSKRDEIDENDNNSSNSSTEAVRSSSPSPSIEESPHMQSPQTPSGRHQSAYVPEGAHGQESARSGSHLRSPQANQNQQESLSGEQVATSNISQASSQESKNFILAHVVPRIEELIAELWTRVGTGSEDIRDVARDIVVREFHRVLPGVVGRLPIPPSSQTIIQDVVALMVRRYEEKKKKKKKKKTSNKRDEEDRSINGRRGVHNGPSREEGPNNPPLMSGAIGSSTSGTVPPGNFRGGPSRADSQTVSEPDPVIHTRFREHRWTQESRERERLPLDYHDSTGGDDGNPPSPIPPVFPSLSRNSNHHTRKKEAERPRVHRSSSTIMGVEVVQDVGDEHRKQRSGRSSSSVAIGVEAVQGVGDNHRDQRHSHDKDKSRVSEVVGNTSRRRGDVSEVKGKKKR